MAHVLSWSEYPDYRADPSNVLQLSKTHHVAFDQGLFPIDRDHELRVGPAFETEIDLLKRTIVDRAGESVVLLDRGVDPEYLARHNATPGWL